MITSQVALQLFAKRLASRSVLTGAEEAALLGLSGYTKNVKAYTDLIRMGEVTSQSCLVVKGLIGRFGQNSDGVRQITCLYIPGDMADLTSIVSPTAGWGLFALSATTVLNISHSELRRVATRHPGLAEAFWRDCVADGSISSEWVVNVGHRRALARLAHLLCEMAIRCERAGQGNRHRFPLPIRQIDLGDATGLTPVHVNRTLRELRVKSIAEVRIGTVTINDWDRLVEVGEFDPAFMLLDGPASRISEIT